MTNCIFTGNNAEDSPHAEFYVYSGTSLSVSYCNVEGGLPASVTDGGNNLNAVPASSALPPPVPTISGKRRTMTTATCICNPAHPASTWEALPLLT